VSGTVEPTDEECKPSETEEEPEKVKVK